MNIHREKISAAVLVMVLGLIPVSYAADSLQGTTLDSSTESTKAEAAAKEEWAYSIGLQAYVFGLPLTVIEKEYARRTDAEIIARIRHLCPCAMINEVGHNEKLATADHDIPYTANNDTVYSGVLVDATDEPIIITVPNIEDRYWSLQVGDPYAENIFYLGSRASEGKGGHHAFIAPGWEGKLPAGVVLHRMDHSVAMAAFRIGVMPDDVDDLVRVNKLQRQIQSTSLENFRAGKFGQASLPSSAKDRGQAQGEFALFHTIADLMGRYPPAGNHSSMVSQFATIGLIPGQPFDADALDEPVRRGLRRALDQGAELIKWKAKHRGTFYAGWDQLPEGRWGFDYLARAATSLVGMMVHDNKEAVYFSTYKSADEELLHSQNNYRLHFKKDELPPLLKNGFWSLTMYGMDFQLVKNSINRFSIGDRTQGLKYNQDGSLDIYIQHSPPEGKESNWLPSPEANLFRIVHRVYLPQEAAQNPATLAQYLPSLPVSD